MPRNKETVYKDTRSWNPFVGCNFGCTYCKPSFQKLIAWVGRRHHCEACQSYSPHEHPERLGRLPRDRTIFVCGDGDISFADPRFMKKVFQQMRLDCRKDRTWFVQSKNPRCFEKYLRSLPKNTYLAATLETNRDDEYDQISQAPKPSERYEAFLKLKWDKKIVTVEPILDFDPDIFIRQIVSLRPRAVFIGYNSRPERVQLPEPDKRKTWQLIHSLDAKGIKVLKKEMRDKRVLKKAYRDFQL
jgi:hypothetical protein